MRLLTWNIQSGRGCDGRVDLARIVETARALADADVFCFQEVGKGFPSMADGADQPAELAALLPDFRPVFAPAVEIFAADGRPQCFGNMVLSRLPVLAVFNHLLPWPAEPARRSMQRHALEVLIETPRGILSVTTTHLEYHAEEHRVAQVERLRELRRQSAARARSPHRDTSAGPYRTIAPVRGAILCGDFNLGPEDPLHARMLAPLAADGSAFQDAWLVCHPETSHAPTCGIADRAQWPQGPHCRDFVFVSGELAPHLARIEVDVTTTASDHQPVMIELSSPSRAD